MVDSLLLPVNMEALVSAFLRDQDEVTDIFDDRVYTVLPDGVTYPCARVNEYDTQHSPVRPLYLVTHVLQIDVWGGSKGEANRGLRTIMAAMSQRMLGGHPDHDAVVSRVTFRGMADRPDEEHEPAKPRWLVTAMVTAHPLP